MDKESGQILFWPYKRNPRVGEILTANFLPEIGVEIEVLKVISSNEIEGKVKYIDLRKKEI